MVCYFLFLNDGRLSEYKTGQEAALEMVPKLGLDQATSEVVIALIKEITGYDVEHLKTQKGVTIDSLRATLDILSTMHKSKQVEQVETAPLVIDEGESTELRELRTSLAALQGTEAQLQDLKTKSAGDEAATQKLIVGSKEFMETVDALLAIMNLNELTTIANYQDAKTAIEDIKKQRGGSASEQQSDIEQLLRQQKTQLIAICDKYIGILDKFIKDEEGYQKINTDLEQSIEWWQNKTEEIKTSSELANATNSERVLTLQRVIEELKEEKETLETNKGVKAQLIQSLEGALDEATAKLTAEQTDANELSVSQSQQLKISKKQTKEAEQARAAAEAEAQAAQKAQAAAESQRQTSEQAQEALSTQLEAAQEAKRTAEKAKGEIELQYAVSVATAEGYKQAAIAAAAIAEQEKKTLVAEANAEKERIVAEMTDENNAAQATAAAATKEKDAAEERAAKAEQDKKTAEAAAKAATTAKNAAEAAAKEATTAKREAEAAAAKAEQDKNAAIKAAARYNSEKEAAIQKAAAATTAKGVAEAAAAEAEATAAEASAAAAAAIDQLRKNKSVVSRASKIPYNMTNYKDIADAANETAAKAIKAAAKAEEEKNAAVAAEAAATKAKNEAEQKAATAEEEKDAAIQNAKAFQREVQRLTEAIKKAQKEKGEAEQQVIRLNAAVATANSEKNAAQAAATTAQAAATTAEAAATKAQENAQEKIKAAEEKASKAQAKAAKAQANAAEAEEKAAKAIAEKDAALEAAAKAVASANKKRDAAKEATDTAIAAAKEATERADAAIAAAKEEKTRANEEVAAAQEETERANEAEGELRVYMEVIKHLLTDIKNTRTELHGKNHDDDVAINQLLNLYLRYDIETEANLKETEPGQLKQMLQSLKTKPTQYLVDELRAQSMLSINTLLDQIDDPTDQDLQIARAQLGAMESVSLKWAQPRSQTFNRLREIQELKSTLKKLEDKQKFNAIWVEVGKQLDLASMICLRELDVGLLKQQLTERKSFIVAFENGSAQLEEMKATKPDPFNDMLSEIQALIDKKSPNLTDELARIVGKYSTSSSSSASKPSSGRP